MPFEVTDNTTGQTLIFDSKPTDSDMNEAFNIVSKGLQVFGEEDRKKVLLDIQKQKQENIATGIETFKREAPETIGGIIGGIGGAAIGKTPSAVRAGAVAGAGVGGAIGEAGRQLFTEEQFTPKDIAISGATQAGAELGGRAVVGVAGKILAPFGKTITPEGAAAKELLDQFTPKNTISVLPAQITESRTLDLMQNMSEKSLIGGTEIAEFKNVTSPKIVDNMIDDLVSRFGASVEPDVLGEAVEEIVSGNLKASRIPAQTIYNTISERLSVLKNTSTVEEKIATGLFDPNNKEIIRTLEKTIETDVFPTKSLKDFARPLQEKAKKLGRIGSTNSGDDIIDGIMRLPDNLDYATLQDLRSRLLAKADEFSITNKKAPAIGKAKKLASLSDEAIGRTLRDIDSEALGMWRNANKIWRSTGEQFNNKFIRGLIKEAATKNNPEIIASKIFKPGGISNIRKIKGAVDDKTFQQLKRWHVDSLLKKSADKEGTLNGDAFLNSMFGKTGMGEQAMKEIYSPIELSSLKNSANALKVIQKKQAEGGGGMFIQLAQPTAAVGLLTGRAEPLAMAVLGGPAVLAKIMTHPRGSKWLLSAAKLPPNSPQAAAIIAKLSNLAVSIRNELGESVPTELAQEFQGTSTLR